MQQGFISNNVKAINDAYKTYSDYTKQVTDNIKEMHQAVLDANKNLLEQEKYTLDLQKTQQAFNKDMNITARFYQFPNNSRVYDSLTGQEITQDQYKQLGGVGQEGDYADIQSIDPSANAKHSTAYTEWKDY